MVCEMVNGMSRMEHQSAEALRVVVEFVTRLGDLEINRKFKLKDMVAGGRLQL